MSLLPGIRTRFFCLEKEAVAKHKWTEVNDGCISVEEDPGARRERGQGDHIGKLEISASEGKEYVSEEIELGFQDLKGSPTLCKVERVPRVQFRGRAGGKSQALTFAIATEAEGQACDDYKKGDGCSHPYSHDLHRGHHSCGEKIDVLG